jgi:lipopolysaccharide transport system ATP-binding protein
MTLHVTLRNVSKVFPLGGTSGSEVFMNSARVSLAEDKVAVNNVSFAINQGERLGIVGRNGAGKSTLLHLIAGLSSPTDGLIEINGKVTSIMTLGVGLRDDLTGRENIYVDGEIQGKTSKEIDAVVAEVIDFADIGAFIDYPVRTYSTGMKARLAFSMISYIDPEILIIDEALSVGDADFSTKATKRIQEICARGKIVIVVSHSMSSIKNICNRCLWMDNGAVVMDGTPDQVTLAYLDAVRGQDEADLFKKFSQYIGSHSFHPDCSIAQIDWFSGAGKEPNTLLESGVTARLQINGSVVADSTAQIRVRIVRLDDLLLFDEVLNVVDYIVDQKSFGVEIEMTPLVVGVGVYRLDITIEKDADILAEASSIFEVYTLNPHAGGKPMLVYPIHATSSLPTGS